MAHLKTKTKKRQTHSADDEMKVNKSTGRKVPPKPVLPSGFEEDPLSNITVPRAGTERIHTTSGRDLKTGKVIPSERSNEETRLRETTFMTIAEGDAQELANDIQSAGLLFPVQSSRPSFIPNTRISPAERAFNAMRDPSSIDPDPLGVGVFDGGRRPPTRSPPEIPERITRHTTDIPNVQVTIEQLGQPERIDRRITEVPVVHQSFENPSPFNGRDLMMGGDLSSRDMRSISDSVGGIPPTYVDHLAPESEISRRALDRERFHGVNPRDMSVQDVQDIERMREQEHKDDANRVSDIVDEIEILSGGQNDSLMGAQDLVDPNGKPQEDDQRGHAESGLRRGREAHSIQEIDLENIQQGIDEFFNDDALGGGITDNLASIGRRFGEAIPTVRHLADDADAIMKSAESISTTIRDLTGLSDKDGRWFSKDDKLEKDLDVEERMGDMNRIPVNKDVMSNLGKFNPFLNTGNSLMMSQGASLGSIGRIRKEDIQYRQPNRSFKGDAVNLARLGRQTAIKNEHEFEP